MRTYLVAAMTAAALVTLTLTAGPAHAGTDGPGGASSVGGSTSMTWTWAGRGTITDIDMQVLDTRCDKAGSNAQRGRSCCCGPTDTT